jgi:hypothetical protein
LVGSGSPQALTALSPMFLDSNVLEEEQAVALPLFVGLEGGFNAVFFRIFDEFILLDIEET